MSVGQVPGYLLTKWKEEVFVALKVLAFTIHNAMVIVNVVLFTLFPCSVYTTLLSLVTSNASLLE